MKKLRMAFFILYLLFNIADAQWISQNSGTNQNLYDIEFINEKTGWAVGDAGVVIKTTNGGTNWWYVQNPSPVLSPNLWSVCPIDSDIVYVTSSGDFIMKTTNGGENWNVLHACPDCNSSTKGIHFLNKDTGWILGAYKVFRTYDGGMTLDSFYVPWFENFEIYFKDINTGVFCGTGRAFKSTDKGESWFQTLDPGPFQMYRKMGVSNNNLWLGGGDPNIYKSTNFGDTWFICDSSHGAFGIAFVNDNTGFIGGGLNYLYKTTNGGINFARERTDPSSLAFISSIAFVNDTVGYYCCGVGRIYKTTTGGEPLTTSIHDEINYSDSFILYQNYPNPFNGSTTFQFEVNIPGNYKLEILDLLGCSIDVLFNKKLNSGRHSINYNPEGLSSGIYVYRITSGKFSQSKRFVLIK